MTIQIECNCGKSYRISDDKLGRRFRCKDCGETLTVENQGSGRTEDARLPQSSRVPSPAASARPNLKKGLITVGIVYIFAFAIMLGKGFPLPVVIIAFVLMTILILVCWYSLNSKHAGNVVTSVSKPKTVERPNWTVRLIRTAVLLSLAFAGMRAQGFKMSAVELSVGVALFAAAMGICWANDWTKRR